MLHDVVMATADFWNETDQEIGGAAANEEECENRNEMLLVADADSDAARYGCEDDVDDESQCGAHLHAARITALGKNDDDWSEQN